MKPRDISLSGTSGELRAETVFIRAVYSKSSRACGKASSNKHYTASWSIPNNKHTRAIAGNAHGLHWPFKHQPPCSSVLPAYNPASPEARCRTVPTPRANFHLRAPVAQWIEHLPPKKGVTRSIRVGGAKPISETRHRLETPVWRGFPARWPPIRGAKRQSGRSVRLRSRQGRLDRRQSQQGFVNRHHRRKGAEVAIKTLCI